MKKLLSLLIFISGSVVWAASPNIKYRCNALFISHLHCRGMHGRPNPEYIYKLDGAIPVQKLKGGYIITVAPEFTTGGCGGNAVAFLYTDKPLAEQEQLSGWAYYAGQYEYEAMSGYPKSVIALKMYGGNAEALEARAEPEKAMRPVKVESETGKP